MNIAIKTMGVNGGYEGSHPIQHYKTKNQHEFLNAFIEMNEEVAKQMKIRNWLVKFRQERVNVSLVNLGKKYDGH